MENTDAKTDEELDEKLQEFIEMYNNGEFEYENTVLDDAYEILEKAEHAKTEKQAIKLAKQAYEKCPSCFDAILFQTDLEENSIKRMKLLNEGLDFEKNDWKRKIILKKTTLVVFMEYMKQDLIFVAYGIKQNIS